MLGPVLRVGVPLDWICHLEPVSSDVQLQKEGSLAQPKSQANHRKAERSKIKITCHRRETLIMSLSQEEKLPAALGFTRTMTAGPVMV